MNPRQRWKGELARPIRFTVKRPHGFAVPDPAIDPEAESKIRAENELMYRLRDKERAKAESSKLQLLAEHYKVTPNRFRALALALARDFVPGFRLIDKLIVTHPLGVVVDPPPKVKMGRSVVWGSDRLEELLTEVDAIKGASGGTNREALARLARKKKWSPPANHRGGRDKWIETLESRLQDAKRQHKFFASALEYHNEMLAEAFRKIRR
jgi:hypothetical protein